MRRFILLLLLALLAAGPVLAQPSAADAEVAFTYGVRAFNHGDYAEAVRLFQEALAADPKHREAREWLALAQRRQTAGETVATPGFGGLLALRDQPRFDFRAGAFYGEDSNPALMPDDAIAFIPGFGTLQGEVDDRVTDLNLRAAAYPVYGRGGFSLGLTGEVKSARFGDLGFLDERQWSAAVQLAWGSDPLGYLTGPMGYTRVPSSGQGRVSFLLQAGRSDLRQDGDPLVTADEVALSLVFRETVKTATQIELDFQRRDVLDGAFEPDVWSAGLSQFFYLGRRDRYLRLGVLREEETDGLNGDVTSLAGSAELALPLGDRLTLQLAAARRKDEINSGDPFEFDDTTNQAGASLSWQLIQHLFLIGRATWAERDSTVPITTSSPLNFRDYQRTTAALGIQWIW